MNWIDIDKNIINIMAIYDDKDKLFTDVKKLYNWNDSQVKYAVEPLLKRWGWYDKKITPTTKTKKIVTKTKSKAKPKAKPKAKKNIKA
jgi:hypothetical protein